MSKYFTGGTARGKKLHLFRGKGGVAGEISELRRDIAEALDGVEADVVAVGGGSNLVAKAGAVLPVAFSGTPLKATVAFSFPYDDNAYAVTLSAETANDSSYLPTVETKTAAGFTINLNSNVLVDLVSVLWTTREIGE